MRVGRRCAMAGGASAPVNPDGTRGTGGPMGEWTVQHPSPPGEGFRSPTLITAMFHNRLYTPRVLKLKHIHLIYSPHL